MHGPLIILSRDDLVEAHLLEPIGEEHRTCPMLEEESVLLGEELELSEAPEAAASLPEHLEIPKPMEPTQQINPLSTSASPSPTSKPSGHPP